ncbi:ferric reductase-like transmembrane domain-containing protein [Alicyclobacillus sp. SO9]|uniref:ferric reductase-like transmembrane domain-containing protein n=1 Tax=Alicyclobacillus sp. SO9 TaxID=2665646 RepID=UPI0018E7B4B9|nr:ferric reductase-like transmembrane domain-containing protein [Alicyclobacillus sp. SO9]QQE77813.1 ferric reductase-like transmembrane domain-containing protein [Alicyclobacillus sp. SO9]
MDVIDERQTTPLMLSIVFVTLIALFSFAYVRVAGLAPAQADLRFWYMARASGLIAYVLLSLTVLLGATGKAAIWDGLRARRVVTLVHQFSSLLLIPFLALHLLGLHADTSVPFSWRQMLVPGTATYRVAATAVGTIGFYGIVLILLSSVLRRKQWIGIWRFIHYLTFPVFVLVTIHGIWAGTDAHQAWALLVYFAAGTAFVITLLRRFVFPAG